MSRATVIIVALVGQKGGVGKSTLSVSLAAEGLARGLRVLLVDADPQGTARTWGDVAAELGQPAPVVIAMGAQMHKPGQLRQAAEAYDLVVIDSPPRLGDVQRSALMVADIALLPSGQTAADAWAIAATAELVTEAQTLRPSLKAAVVIARKQRRTALGEGARGTLAATGLPILTTEIGQRVAYQEAIQAGKGASTYAPRDAAAAEIRALFEEIYAFAGAIHGKEKSAARHPKKTSPAKDGAVPGRKRRVRAAGA